MAPEGDATGSSCSPAPSVKRGRDPEDEVYVDNLHSHKRYLSEIMASSLNGLTVGDPLSETLMDAPARDELSLQYSPMSDDSYDSRYYDGSANTCSTSQPESAPTSPVSPYRSLKPLNGFTTSGPPTTSHHSHGSIISSISCAHPRQRGSDNEGRFPSSPSDICHSADLRRAALLRSVQMRAQPLGSSQCESPFTPSLEHGETIEAEERACSYMKIDGRRYQMAECNTAMSTTDGGGKTSSVLQDVSAAESECG